MAKLDANLSSLLAATFVGGSAYESSRGLSLDDTGGVYIAGYTLSDDFPGVGPGSADSTRITPSVGEAFVARLDTNLAAVLAATFLGGHAGQLR